MVIPHFWYHLHMFFAVIFLSLSALGIGLRLQQLLLKNTPFSITSLSIGYFCGQALLASWIFLVSWILPHPYNSILGVIASLMGCWWLLQSIPKNVPRAKLKLTPLETMFSLGIVGILFFVTTYSFHRPSEWDEVAYHVPAMQEIAQGSLNFPLLQDSPYTSFYSPFSFFYGSLPYAAEAYASFGYSIANRHESTAHLVYTVNFVFFLALIYGFLRIIKVNRLAILTVLLLITLDPGIIILLSIGLIDINASIFQLLSCLLLIFAQREKKSGYIWLSILCLGAAFGHKFTTAFLLPIYIPWLYLVAKKLVSFKDLFFKGSVWWVGGGGVWYLKNLLLHTNPVYPLYLGHQGMSEEKYQFLTETLIHSLRASLSISGLWQTVITQYAKNFSLLVIGLLVIVGFFWQRSKVEKYNYWLLATVIGMWMFNYILGSQLSRYVLLLPITFYILAARYIQQSVAISLGIVLVILLSHRSDMALVAFWKARLDELPYVFMKGHESDKREKIGCLAPTVAYCQQYCEDNTKMLNLWDAYAAVYYQDTNFFYSPPQSDFTSVQLPGDVKYLFTNERVKQSLLENPTPHRDMEPELRSKYQEELLVNARLLFIDGECSLYELADSDGKSNGT